MAAESRRYLLLLAGLLLLGAAALCDVRTAGWVHEHRVFEVVQRSHVAKIAKWPGDFRFTLVIAAAILGMWPRRWRGVLVLLFGGVLAGLFYTLVKWSVGRTRPFPRNIPAVGAFEFHPFRRGIEGLWKADNQAFPSGHACLAFATAATLSAMFPRGRVWFYFAALMVGVERVLENAHYPSDVAGGLIFGALASMAAAKCVHRLFPPSVESQGFPVE